MNFTPTRAYTAILETLELHHHVVILGRPGDGKTTLGFQALHVMQEKHKCIPLLPETHSLEFLPHIQNPEKVSIFLDDQFGIYSVTGESMTKALVYQLLSVLRKGNFLLMSLRKDIYLQCKMRLPKELFSKDIIVDLTKQEFELLDDEKRSLLQSIPNVSEETVKKILSHQTFSNKQIGFPQCVALMKESNISDFQNILATPMKYIVEQCVLLYENFRDKFLVLVMAFANQGQICEEDIRKRRLGLPKDIDDS